MLKDLLENKKIFKLVCGAGNEDAEEVGKLVALYSMAGCNFFDLSAKPEIVDAAKRGLEFAGIKNDRYLCVSVGIQGDPHVSKAVIDSEKCKKCGRCYAVCPQKTIVEKDLHYKVNKTRCIGCLKCVEVCPAKCIEMVSEFVDFKEVLPPLVAKGVDCVEFHTLGENEAEVDEKWADINACFSGILSICIDRSKLGNEKLLSRLKRMLKTRQDFTTIIQADGCPMSGSEDDYKTTLQTVAAAEIVQNAKLPVYIILSGGTNSKTTELASLCGINFHGVAIGTFARKIVEKYISRKDFLTNKIIFEEALKIAKNLVEKSMEKMG